MATSSPLTGRPPLAEFTNRFVQPPSAYYVDADDRLFLQGASSVAATVFRASARILSAEDGTIRHWQQKLPPTVTRTPVEQGFPLLEGYLLGISLDLFAGASGDSWNYGSIGISAGAGEGPESFHTLARGYLSATAPLIWPHGDYRDPLQGRGILLLSNQAAPAAGAEQLFTIPAFTRVRVAGARLPFTTSAAAANRRVIFQVRNDVGSILFESAPALVQAASLAFQYQLAHWGESGDDRNGRILTNWPPELVIPSEFQLATQTVNLQGGDQFGIWQLLLEEWFED